MSLLLNFECISILLNKFITYLNSTLNYSKLKIIILLFT
jgi:hypothetical protein